LARGTDSPKNGSMAVVLGRTAALLIVVSSQVSASEVQLTQADHFCVNRGGYGGSNQFSKQVSANDILACVSFMKTVPGCGFAFNYDVAAGWCDCVPASVGECQPAFEAGTNVYEFPVVKEVHLVHENQYCINRGGTGGENQFSRQVGGNDLVACISYLKTVADCGFAFGYNFHYGWCSCVPASAGACLNAYEVDSYVYHFITTTTTTMTVTTATATVTATALATTTPPATYIIKNYGSQERLFVNSTKGLEPDDVCAHTRWRIDYNSLSSVTFAVDLPSMGFRFLGHCGFGIQLAEFGGPSFTWNLTRVGSNDTYVVCSNVQDNSGNSYLALSRTGRVELRDRVGGSHEMWDISLP